LNSKHKLTQCLRVLEQLDREQEVRTAEVRQTLGELDSRYREQLSRLKRSEKDCRTEQRQRLVAAQKNLRKLQRALHRIQSGQREQLKSLVIVQKDFASSAPIFVSANADDLELKRVEKRRVSMTLSKRWRDEREAMLVESRLINDGLRRQVAEIKHELKFGQRCRRICAMGETLSARVM
jgi:ribosome-binding ATPase YchF (GTP1/OBG family)